MTMKFYVTRSALLAADPTSTEVSLKIARHFRVVDGREVSASRLAMTWGQMSQEDAKSEGFKCVASLASDLAEDPQEEAARALEWARKYVLEPVHGVSEADVIWASDLDFQAAKDIARARGSAFILICESPQGYTAGIQTAAGLCEPGSTLALQNASDAIQAYCRNLNRVIQQNLPALLREDGVSEDEWLECQEDARVAHDALHGPGMDADGYFWWE